MKLTLDTAVNVLLGLTCVVITSVGVVDLRARLAGTARPSAPAQADTPAPSNVPKGSPRKPPPVEDVNGLTIPTTQGLVRAQGAPKVALVEFSDFECPFCGAFERGAYQQIQHDFVESGKVEYVFIDFPRESIHPRALSAAEAFRCAADQGRPWEMHDRLFQNQKSLADADLLEGAKDLGLNVDKFTQCVAGKAVPKVRDELALGDRAGIAGTPSFLVGQVQPNGDVRVSKRITGAAPYNVFKDQLDAALVPVVAAR